MNENPEESWLVQRLFVIFAIETFDCYTCFCRYVPKTATNPYGCN